MTPIRAALGLLAALSPALAAAAAPAGTPAFDPKSLRGTQEGPLTEVLTLGSAHLSQQEKAPSAADLELLAARDDADVPAQHGWRRELFGEDALALKHGRIALTTAGKAVKIVNLKTPVSAG